MKLLLRIDIGDEVVVLDPEGEDVRIGDYVLLSPDDEERKEMVRIHAYFPERSNDAGRYFAVNRCCPAAPWNKISNHYEGRAKLSPAPLMRSRQKLIE